MMSRFVVNALAVLSTFCPASLLGSDNEARMIVERAIAAQGGEDQVAKLTRSWHARVGGTRDGQAMVGETFWQPPDQFKADLKIEVRHGDKIRVVAVLNGEKGWQSTNGVTQEMTGSAVAELREAQFRSRKIRSLLPLLTDRAFSLSALGERPVGDRPTLGVRIQSEDSPDVDLFFDKQQSLLLKKEIRVRDASGRESLLETFYSDYKNFDGVKLATRITKHKDGKLQSTQELTDITFMDRVDPREFARP